MRKLTIDIADKHALNGRFKAAMQGEEQGEYLSFTSIEQLHQLINPRRLTIIEAIQKRGPIGLRELARQLSLDPGNLARDIRLLKQWGLVQEAEKKLIVPYDEIRLELVLAGAA